MTPKEKAKELFFTYYDYVNPFIHSEPIDYNKAKAYCKECSLITIDEVLKTLDHEDLWIRHESNIDDFIKFWEEVKKEIENL